MPGALNTESVTGMDTTELPLYEPQVGKDRMRLELRDKGGRTYEKTYEGFAFGAKTSVAGELVFQTGMVGYPEALTDPSYRGQILVMTFPLVGNYGVPSRKTVDNAFKDIPAHFEASQIHVSGLAVASYSGEDYSHHLAASSLGTWLSEQGIPAMYGVDTRALTKRIREGGSVLGRMLIENGRRNMVNGHAHDAHPSSNTFESIDWTDPNVKNLVRDGESAPNVEHLHCRVLTRDASIYKRAQALLST